jgi:hypothetical protein
MNRIFKTLLPAAALILSLTAFALADTIRLKNGSVIRGQVIGFKDQQFTILVGNGTRGRQSRITLYMEDIESIEFDSAGTTASNAGMGTEDNNAVKPSAPTTQSNSTTSTQPDSQRPSVPDSGGNSTTPVSTPAPRSTSPTFFQIKVRVRGDNVNNGWTNSGLVVRRGQHLRISASGRVSLGQGRISTPTGVPTLPDKDKLMRTEPTGAMIAVIGDDNDDFVFIGARREFVAQRDGVLFLGVNEGNLGNNSGAYDATVEAEAVR